TALCVDGPQRYLPDLGQRAVGGDTVAFDGVNPLAIEGARDSAGTGLGWPARTGVHTLAPKLTHMVAPHLKLQPRARGPLIEDRYVYSRRLPFRAVRDPPAGHLTIDPYAVRYDGP